MPVLVKDVVNAAINELSQVPGIATQTYSSNIIRQFVQNAYTFEIDELWWPQYMYYQQVAIDGTTGLLAADLKGPISFVDDYTDIAAVWPEGSNRKLREMSPGINPYTTMSAGRAMYLAPDMTTPHRPFKVFPANSTGNVVVWARQSTPTPFGDNDSLYLDQLLLMYDACWMYATDDGTVPAQVNKYQMLAVKRRNRLKAALAQHSLELDPRVAGGTDMITQTDMNDWFVLDADPLA
jgi:hypothetical protein